MGNLGQVIRAAPELRLGLRFEVASDRATLELLSSLFGKLTAMLREFANQSAEGGSGNAQFHVDRLVLASPLEMLLSVANAPAAAFRAAVTFLKHCIYHEETRNRLAAQSELEWQKVEAERLKNIAAAICIAKELSGTQDVKASDVRTLLELSRWLQGGQTLRLTSVQLPHEDGTDSTPSE
jgi:hypothetical protein